MADDLMPPMRDFLIARGLVRKPSVAGLLHPLWLDPRDGVPAPGEGVNADEIDNDVVFGAVQVMGFPKPPHEQRILRIDAVDFWIRSRNAPLGRMAAEPIIDAFADRRQWDMAGLPIVESLIERPLQKLASDEHGFTFTMQFTFERFADLG